MPIVHAVLCPGEVAQRAEICSPLTYSFMLFTTKQTVLGPAGAISFS
jgi:hypothetical protein